MVWKAAELAVVQKAALGSRLSPLDGVDLRPDLGVFNVFVHKNMCMFLFLDRCLWI